MVEVEGGIYIDLGRADFVLVFERVRVADGLGSRSLGLGRSVRANVSKRLRG